MFTFYSCFLKDKHQKTSGRLTTIKARFQPLPPPAIIELTGGLHFLPMGNKSQWQRPLCPDTHFLCPSSQYCLPVFVRCNKVHDCPGHEDEVDCRSHQCPGLLRCRQSTVCVHSREICDGVPHCPLKDDEMLCNVSCPDVCTCYGWSFMCNKPFRTGDFPEIRYVEAALSGMEVKQFQNNTMLIYLGLLNCGISSLLQANFPNLHTLDLRSNALMSITGGNSSHNLPKLRVLRLSDNPLIQPFQDVSQMGLPSLEILDLPGVEMPLLDSGMPGFGDTVKEINLSGSALGVVREPGFGPAPQLRVLDLTGCPMTSFPLSVFQNLPALQNVIADNFKLCCPEVLPDGVSVANCHAPSNDVSSCDSLLPSHSYRVSLAVFAVVAITGNAGSVVYRVFQVRGSAKFGFHVFVIHLCASDFLMGLYLAVIGVADRWYHKTYLWRDVHWKQSSVCSMAGFLSLVSSEVSALVISLITLDRFIVLKFPFSHVHFKLASAHAACVLAWILGVVIGTVPLLPWTSQWGLYQQTGICIPLPVTQPGSPAYTYSFAVLIVFNMVLCVWIAVGQILIYWSVRTNAMATVASHRSKDHIIARRLLIVSLSDFLCWFPISCAGTLASQGVVVSSDVNVALAVLVVPFNSAVNPFMYSLNVLLERRRLAREQKMLKHIQRQML